MTDKEKILTILQKILPEDINAEISVRRESEKETKLRKNTAVESIDRRNHFVQVRVEQGGRVGVYSTNRLTVSALREALSRARENASWGRPGPLILTGSTGYREMDLFSRATANLSPQSRTALLAPVFKVADKAGMAVSGVLSAQAGEYALANTAGLAAWTRATVAQFCATVTSVDGLGIGYGYACDRNIDKLDCLDPFLQAAAKCQAADKPRPLTPGKYTVILEPAAVADLLAVVAETVLNGRAYLEARSPVTEIGSRIFGENITIWDDALDSKGLAMPFDFQGVPKQRLNLVSRGVVQNLALDNETAASLNRAGTGHASVPGSNLGPVPAHIFMEPGNAMYDDMITSTKDGLLISRLHNLVVLDPREGLITGTTGHGTLLIENGKLKAALPNLRFVQNLVQTLNQVEMTGDETRLFGGLWGGMRVPALKIGGFSIIGSNIGYL